MSIEISVRLCLVCLHACCVTAILVPSVINMLGVIGVDLEDTFDGLQAISVGQAKASVELAHGSGGDVADVGKTASALDGIKSKLVSVYKGMVR